MYVRMKIGQYKGELREFPYVVAQTLIARGDAVQHHFGAEAPQIKPAAEITVAPEANIPKVTVAPAKKKKGKR